MEEHFKLIQDLHTSTRANVDSVDLMLAADVRMDFESLLPQLSDEERDGKTGASRGT